jgi:hypothetical protein
LIKTVAQGSGSRQWLKAVATNQQLLRARQNS